MSKLLIFTLTAVWDEEAKVWSGHCDDIPAAADDETLDGIMAKISRMALDLAPDKTTPACLRTPSSSRSWRCATPAGSRREWRRSSIDPCETC